MTRTPFSFNNQGWTGELIFFSVKKCMKIKKRQQGITTCCQIKAMLYVSRWSYIKNSQDRKMFNFMLIASQGIYSLKTYQCFYLLCLWIINCDLCVWYSKLSELSLFSLKFINTCISAFHICITISDLIFCVK